MPTMQEQANLKLIEKFVDHWSAGELDKVLALMADDAIFAPTTGPEPGRRYQGIAAIRAVLAPVVRKGSHISLEPTEILASDDRVVMTWTSVDADQPAATAKMFGIDLFRIVDSRIVLKDAYRKSY